MLGKERARQSTPEYAKAIVAHYQKDDDDFANLILLVEAKHNQKMKTETSTAMTYEQSSPAASISDNIRREAISASVATLAAGAFGVMSWPCPSKAATPLDAGEAIRRGAANIPGYGQTDVFYPENFVGTWKVIREVEFNGRSDSTLRLSYPFRFIQSIEDGAVVADRGFNQAELEKSIISTIKGGAAGSAVQSYEWVQTNPNDLRIILSDGTKKEIKVTKRATERTADTASSSEFQRVLQEDQRGIPAISARRVVSRWKTVDDKTLEALEIVYDMGGGDPLASGGTKEGTILSKSRLLLVKQ
ncbi:MAG: hypothetical protein SGILL_009682 [Bacillariaceae sp.]